MVEIGTKSLWEANHSFSSLNIANTANPDFGFSLFHQAKSGGGCFKKIIFPLYVRSQCHQKKRPYSQSCSKQQCNMLELDSGYFLNSAIMILNHDLVFIYLLFIH